jgi:site-specific DNA-methyltransferase (adenine-specific)
LDKSLDIYLDEMLSIFLEVYSVTKEGGFCCIIIGNEIIKGTLIPLPHLLIERLIGKWNFHEEIIWNKVTGGLDRFGVTIQHPYPSYYRANIMHEHILVLRKGKLNHQKDEESKLIIDEVMKKDTSNSIWNIPPVPPKFIDHPCPFPEEIPFRLIHLYSNIRDVVLDPFNGSGQTTKVAKNLGRHYIGLDLHQEYITLAKKRLSEDLHLREQIVAKWKKTSKPLS